MKKIIVFLVVILFIISCSKKEFNAEPSNTNISQIDSFLQKISNSAKYIVVPLKDFDKTNSSNKVVIALRHDMDHDLRACLKMAYLEHKYHIRATFYVLHTASYYGITELNYFNRNDDVVNKLKNIQNKLGHEVGLHNDLVTLQVVYNLEPIDFLKTELSFR